MTEAPSYVGLSEAIKAGTISAHSAIIASYVLSIEILSIAVGAAVALVPEKQD